MSLRTVGWRFSVVVGSGLALASVSACSVEDTASSGERSGAERTQPERVVQRIEPARATLAGNGAPGSSRASVAAQPSPAVSSGAAPAGSNTLTAANAPRQVETISPKHLEAELNRLEAEIGN